MDFVFVLQRHRESMVDWFEKFDEDFDRFVEQHFEFLRHLVLVEKNKNVKKWNILLSRKYLRPNFDFHFHFLNKEQQHRQDLVLFNEIKINDQQSMKIHRQTWSSIELFNSLKNESNRQITTKIYHHLPGSSPARPNGIPKENIENEKENFRWIYSPSFTSEWFFDWTFTSTTNSKRNRTKIKFYSK